MNKPGMNFIAVLLQIAKDIFADINNTTEVVPVQAVNNDALARGICRTPADAMVLRLNLEP